jgi:hypothetical protein
MKHEKTLAGVRLAAGVLTLGAILIQLVDSITKDRSVSNFFSFFTVQSNLLVALLLVTVGVYVLLLSGNEQSLQTTIPFVNIVLHYVMPVLILLDWLVFPPQKRLSFRWSLLWLAYPVLYLVYSLVRGAFVDWYPYPFINPVTSGWPNLIGIGFTIALGSLLLTWLLVLRTTLRHSHTS